MQQTKCLAIVFAVSGLAVAIYAAYYWWKASKVAIENPAASISDDPDLHTICTQVAFNKSSWLNSKAAFWTGVAAILDAIAAVLGVL